MNVGDMSQFLATPTPTIVITTEKVYFYFLCLKYQQENFAYMTHVNTAAASLFGYEKNELISNFYKFNILITNSIR